MFIWSILKYNLTIGDSVNVKVGDFDFNLSVKLVYGELKVDIFSQNFTKNGLLVNLNSFYTK